MAVPIETITKAQALASTLLQQSSNAPTFRSLHEKIETLTRLLSHKTPSYADAAAARGKCAPRYTPVASRDITLTPINKSTPVFDTKDTHVIHIYITTIQRLNYIEFAAITLCFVRKRVRYSTPTLGRDFNAPVISSWQALRSASSCLLTARDIPDTRILSPMAT